MVRVLLVDGNGPAGAAIRDVIESMADLDLAWDVHEIPEVLRLLERAHPDLILLSHSLMKSRLVTTVRAIAELSPSAKILLLSTHNDSRIALRTIEAGASGYMLTDRAFEELGNAVRTVMSGRTYLSPGIAGMERVIREGGKSGNVASIEAGKARPDRPKRRKRPRVLVVDDEEEILAVFREALDRAGYAVVTAATAEDAVAALRSEPPDVAFVDLVLPGASGVEVIRAIRELDKTLPVVVVTGYPDSELMYAAMAYSPLLVLAKPVCVGTLLDTARSALAGRLGSSSRIEGFPQ
jgi:DNA-binding NarL/FixJ family response regulator